MLSPDLPRRSPRQQLIQPPFSFFTNSFLKLIVEQVLIAGALGGVEHAEGARQGRWPVLVGGVKEA